MHFLPEASVTNLESSYSETGRIQVKMVVGFVEGWVVWQSADALNSTKLVQNSSYCEI